MSSCESGPKWARRKREHEKSERSGRRSASNCLIEAEDCQEEDERGGVRMPNKVSSTLRGDPAVPSDHDPPGAQTWLCCWMPSSQTPLRPPLRQTQPPTRQQCSVHTAFRDRRWLTSKRKGSETGFQRLSDSQCEGSVASMTQKDFAPTCCCCAAFEKFVCLASLTNLKIGWF